MMMLILDSHPFGMHWPAVFLAALFNVFLFQSVDFSLTYTLKSYFQEFLLKATIYYDASTDEIVCNDGIKARDMRKLLVDAFKSGNSRADTPKNAMSDFFNTSLSQADQEQSFL